MASSLIVISIFSFLVAGLTLFSGFGLGTLLLPGFIAFFPIGTAVAMTAIVHFLNNVFKLALVGFYADRKVVLRFGIPAVIFSFLGAWGLIQLSQLPVLFSYKFNGRLIEVSSIKFLMGALIGVFSLFDLVPRLRNLEFPPRFLMLGGALSGFFGGLSGHQGALRGAFLSKVSIRAETYIGTNVVCAIMVDAARLLVYGWAVWGAKFNTFGSDGPPPVLFAALGAAFLGSFVASRFIKKITINSVRAVIGRLLLLISLLLMAGVI